MKTYVKIYAPPIMDALKELQKTAGEMPKVAHFHFLEALEGMPMIPTTPEGALSSSDTSAVTGEAVTMVKKSRALGHSRT